MKTTILSLALTLFTFLGFSQTDCKPYVPSEEGAKWEITDYNKKGKVEGKTSYELLEKTIDGNNDVTFKIKAISFDKKDEKIYENTFEAYCKDGVFQFDMSFFLDAASMEAYQNMDVEMDASEFEVPDLNASPGTTLKDGHLTVKVANGGMTMFTMTVNVTDRKVEAREEYTTPAGTFDCLVLSQTSSTKMVIKIEGTSKDWYAEDVGMVRSEQYNKKGKLMGYSELTSISK